MSDNPVPGSFRDPSGFVFKRDGIVFRQVNVTYQDDYDHLMNSGLYDALVASRHLIAHTEVDAPPSRPGIAYKTLRPDRVPFISYPYEWPFSALKDAALTTLKIQETALKHGMVLKDASAYNVQFVHAKPVFIDTLSFERYREGEPWIAYGQFCQHFLAPLALMRYRDIRLSSLSRIFIDGVPLDLASRLLPVRTRLRPALWLHIHLHAKTQSRHSNAAQMPKAAHGSPEKLAIGKVSLQGLRGLVDNLHAAISKLNWEPAGTEWATYYDDTNYSSESERNKERLVADMIQKVQPTSVWDFGANTGRFSRLASNAGIPTVAFDIDPAAVEKNYRTCAAKNDTNVLPLVLDLTNPSPSLGWRNAERESLLERAPADMILALALIHHLAISNNVPLPSIAEFLAALCRHLVIEFVPKADSQVQRLLTTRQDIFPDYTIHGFEAAFTQSFHIEDSSPIIGSERLLYRMRSKIMPDTP